MYPTDTPLPDEEPPKPEYGRLGGDEGGDSVPDHGLVAEYANEVRHQENGGASYRLKHLRSAPEQEAGFTTGQGRLLHRAVPYSDDRVVVDAFPDTGLPRDPKPNQLPGTGRSDWEALNRQINPGAHPVFFSRGRDHNPVPAPGPFKPEPAGGTNANGRSIWGGTHRTDDRV